MVNLETAIFEMELRAIQSAESRGCSSGSGEWNSWADLAAVALNVMTPPFEPL
ncbi:hypothetical protein J2R76_003690 [Bradyrhizobium sp. USDA 4532]|uniref:hypothetical protein n=1 Tax=unclassified Bradyrhizobium TaxID=2631580 RepID=UPI0020A1F553|nr:MULTISPECIES: hypothetical protein [unclassified Bradyrhizobium]MCP1835353.1 hypothetical protein [Bradyrhizobium sp. USDA 4545]MCP1920099.1 hypothetical protein [Bradyrhizobium sp. USDA 4532]